MKVELNLREQLADQAVELNEAKEDIKLALLASRMLLTCIERTDIDRRASIECAQAIVDKLAAKRNL
jgi:hypothetical protein